MAALAATTMGAAPVKEKQALLETRRQQAKKAKSVLVGSSSRSVTSEQAGESRSLDIECITLVDGKVKEGVLKRSDGDMEDCVERLALQASSTMDGMGGDVSTERAVGIEFFEAPQSKFCIRQYTEIVRQDRGDLKRSWPLAEEYLRGNILQGRVQVSLWPPIGAGESALSQAYRNSSYPPDVPLPHLFKLEIAFAESGVSEDKPDQSWITAEEFGIEKRVGSHVISSSDLVERRPSEEGACVTRTKSSKAGRKISAATDCSGDGEAHERPKRQDRLLRDAEAKHVEQVAGAETGSQRAASRVDAKEIVRVVESGVKQVHGEDTSFQVKDTGSPCREPGVSVETGKGKRLADAYQVFQEKKTVDKSSKAQVLAENVAEICERIVGIGKGKAASNSGSEVEGGLSSIRTNTQVGDSENNSKRGEREIGDGAAKEKETVNPKRRNEDERFVEERSTKSDGASASRPSTKRQSNKACPVCRSFSSMSQTTMNVHIDSCLVEHRQEDHTVDADPVESEPEPSREPSREITRSKPLKSKGPGAKPKRKKRSIADIVASSVTRTLEESPGKEVVRFLGPYSRSTDQVHDSKNLNWVSGNKKKRQPRNVPSRNLKEENESKRRRISRVESAAEESKAAKQEKRRLPEKEKEGTTKPKQLRVERSAGPSTIITKSSKVQDGVDAESRRSGARKTGLATATSQLPSSRSGPGKGQVTHSNKESNERDVSDSAGPSQSRETRTATHEDIRTELDEIAAQCLGITSPCRSPSSAVENPAPAAAKHRAGKAHSNSGAAGRLASLVPAADRAPKAPWYPPAAMLRSGTISPIVVTEAAGGTPIPEITSGTTKSPGSSLTAENLTDTSRIATLADMAVSTRKSPRSTALNSNKGQKGSRSLPTDAGDGAKTSAGDPSHKTSAQVEVQNMAECRTSKEVDDYSDPAETAVEGMAKLIQHSSISRGGSRAVSVESPRQPSSTGARTEVISEKDLANDVVGKSEGVFHPEKQRAAADKSGRRESVIAQEETVTAIHSEVDVTKIDGDPATRIVQEGCSTAPSGDINAGAGKTPEPAVSRLRKRGGSKAKLRNLSDKTHGKGKRASIGGAGDVEETHVQLSLPDIDVSGETSIGDTQRKEDKLKQEHQRKEKKQQAVGNAVEPTFKWSSDTVQPAFQDMVVRRIEGVMGQEKGAEQKSLKVVGREKRVDLVTSSTNDVSYPSVNQEKSKEKLTLTAQVQANSTHKLQFQRPEEALDNMARLRFGRDTEVSTSSSHIREVISQVEGGGANAQVAIEDVAQSHSPQTWSLVPQRPVGRKKLPIKCTTRSVGSATAVALAAKQVSGHSPSTSNHGAKSIESPGTEGPEKGSSTGDIRAVNNAVSPVKAPKPPMSRSRAARQLAKSVPGSKKGTPHGEVSSPEGQPLIPANAVADPNSKEKSDNTGSTLITPDQQALLSPSTSWVTNPVRVQPSIPPGRVCTDALTQRNGNPEPNPERTRKLEGERVPASVEIGSTAHEIPLADELHCTETLFSSPQSNAQLDIQERASNISTTNQLGDKGSSNVEVTKATESGRNVQEGHSSKLDASVCRLAVSQQPESGLYMGRSPDQSRLGKTAPLSNVHKLHDNDSSESARGSKPEKFPPTVFSSTVGESQRSGRASSSTRSPGKVLEATGRSKLDTAGGFQTLEAGLATFTSGLANTNVRLAAVLPKASSTSTGLNTQLGQGRQNSSIPAVGSTRVSTSRLNSTTIEAGCFQVANTRPVVSTTASLPTSFTSLLQSTTLPPQSSAALSLAMQGTRPLQEACADRSELSRAGVMVSTRGVTDAPRRTLDGLTWGSEKHASSSGNDVSVASQVPAGTAFFRPPPEMGGPTKASEAGDKEVSRLPGWMRAAISDPKGSEPGAMVTTETEHFFAEAVRGMSGSPEGGEMSGPVRVRLWGRDVVVPPNEESTTGTPPTQQGPYGRRSETKRGAGTDGDTVASGLTSTACLDGLPVNAQVGLKANPGPAAARVGEGVAESSHQITVPVINTPKSVIGVVGVSVFGKSNNHQAENYLSRLDYSNLRTPYTANSKEEMRSSRGGKGQTSAALATTPPEVIIIDDSAESPAKSGESFSGEGLTMAFLLDCGALRYLPATQNGRSGSQLMEVDPSKIPQRVVNQNFNILAELRKIGLVPAPKAVLPASYRHSHSLSLEVPHCNPPPASRAGSDVLPPWLLAEKKRKEAQIAENLIVLDDDDEPPAGTAVLGERRSLNSALSPGGGSGQPHSTGQVSSSTSAKSGSETRVTEHPTGAVRTPPLSLGATAISVPPTSHAGVHMRRETSSSPHGNESPAIQKSISRKNDLVVSDMVRPAVEKAHLNANTASDSLTRERSGLESPAANKEHPGGLQTGSGPSPTPPRRHREDNRTDKEKQLQNSDHQNEKKTPKAGAAAHKSGSPAAVVGGQSGPLSKKGSSQGISILAPTWMSGNNGWPKRGAAAQACKQAVERLKAQILSSPSRDGTSQVGPGGVLDFESHMIGQSPEKSTNFGGTFPSAVSCLQNAPATQGGFRYSSLSSRSGGDNDNICSAKEAPHNGRGVGQSPTPGTFTSAVVAAERDVSTVSKSPGVPSVVVHSTVGIQGGAQGCEGNQGQSSNTGVKPLAPSCSNVLDGKMTNLLVQSTLVREPSTSEQSSPAFSSLGKSGSSSPTLRSRVAVGTKTVSEAGSAVLARGAMQSEQGSLLSMQATPFSRLPPSRLSLPLHGATVATSSTKALLEQVCFTTKAATDSFTREVSNLQATMEQPIGRMNSPQKRIQPSRLKSIVPVNSGDKTTANPVSGVPAALSSATIITPSSSAQSRPAPGFPSSCSPSTTDQRMQMESGVVGVVNLGDGTTVVGLNGAGTGISRSPTADLPLSSVFGRMSQTSNSSPRSSQGRYTSRRAAIIPCDGGTWNLCGQTDTDDQASGTGLSDHSPGNGIIPGYRLAPQIARAMVGHSQTPRATSPSSPISCGFFGHRGNAGVEHTTKESDSSPRSRDSDCIGVSAHDRYSYGRSSREEKMKDARRESPKFTTTETSEKIRTKSLNSI